MGKGGDAHGVDVSPNSHRIEDYDYDWLYVCVACCLFHLHDVMSVDTWLNSFHYHHNEETNVPSY